MTRFEARLAEIISDKQTLVGLWLSPRLDKLPLPMMRLDDPFLPFGKALIAATRDLVWGYVFDLAAYMALGAAGMVALERTIAYANADDDVVTILHGPFASADYLAAASDSALNVDGVTVSHARLVPAYEKQHGAGVFVIGSNGAGADSAFDPVSGALYVSGALGMIGLRVLGDAVVYASRGDDFAAAARDAAVRMRQS